MRIVPAGKSNCELELLFHKQRQRRGKSVQIIFPADRADFSITKKPGESERPEFLLHQFGIVIRAAKKIFAAAIATAKATAVNRRAADMFFCARKQFAHVFVRRIGVAPLKLHRLAGTRQRADGQHAGIRVAANQVSHEKIAAMKIFEIFVHDQTDEQIAARFCCSAGGSF